MPINIKDINSHSVLGINIVDYYYADTEKTIQLLHATSTSTVNDTPYTRIPNTSY